MYKFLCTREETNDLSRGNYSEDIVKLQAYVLSKNGSKEPPNEYDLLNTTEPNVQRGNYSEEIVHLQAYVLSKPGSQQPPKCVNPPRPPRPPTPTSSDSDISSGSSIVLEDDQELTILTCIQKKTF